MSKRSQKKTFAENGDDDEREKINVTRKKKSKSPTDSEKEKEDSFDEAFFNFLDDIPYSVTQLLVL